MKIIGKTFSNKKEEIEFILNHHDEIVAMKKAAVKFTDGSIFMAPGPGAVKLDVFKALTTSTKNDTDTLIERTIVGNTYNWMDSHNDVHLDGTFSKSIDERGDKVFHLHDHLQQVAAKVGTPLKVYEQSVKWRDLGVDIAGSTTAVMMDSQIKRAFNPMVFEQYKNAEIDQHSVGMYYVQLAFAANDPDYKEPYAQWQASIDKIGNREKAEEIGYFWAVKEAKLIEISAVLQGSNELTPTVEAKEIEENEPPKGTQKSEPSPDTHEGSGTKGGTVHFY